MSGYCGLDTHKRVCVLVGVVSASLREVRDLIRVLKRSIEVGRETRPARKGKGRNTHTKTIPMPMIKIIHTSVRRNGVRL
jgi:hypothetical protein